MDKPTRKRNAVVRFDTIMHRRQAELLKLKRQQKEMASSGGGGGGGSGSGEEFVQAFPAVSSLVAGCVLQQNRGTLCILTDKDTAQKWVTEAVKDCRLGPDKL
jgi:hypothetical protein